MFGVWGFRAKLKLTNKKEEDEELAGVRDRKVVSIPDSGCRDGQEPDAVSEPHFSGWP